MTDYFKGVDFNPSIDIPRMVTLADGTAYTGTPVEEISVDGAAFGAATNAATSLGDGEFTLALTTAEWATVSDRVKVAMNDALAVGGGRSVTIYAKDPFDSYPTGAFVIDAGGVAGTDFGVNGTPQNPCTTIADMLTMFTAADTLGTAMKRCEIMGVTPITLTAADWDGWEFVLGPNATLTGGATTCDNLTIIGGTVAGTYESASTISVSGSILQGVTANGTFTKCALPQAASLTLNAATNILVDCYSQRAGGTSPTIDCGDVASLSLRVTGYKGDLSVDNVGGATSVIEIDGNGLFDIADTGPTLSGLTVVISGNMNYTTSGSATGMTVDSTARVTNDTVADAVWTEVVADHSATAGSAAETIEDTLVDTGTTIPALIGTPVADLATDIATIDTELGALTTTVGTAGDGLTAINLPNQTMDITGNLSGSVGSVTGAVGSVTGAVGSVTAEVSADVTKISGSATAADNLEESTEAIITGSSVTGTLSTTVSTTDLTGYLDDELIGATIIWKSGTADGQRSDITDYAAASGTVTYTAIATAPANGDLFVIV